MKNMIFVAALTFAAVVPAYAADFTTCDEASITMASDAVKASTISGKAELATVDVNRAKEAMAAGKTEDCVSALNSAMMQIK